MDYIIGVELIKKEFDVQHTQHTPDLSIPLTPEQKRWDKIADICTAVLVAAILFTGVFWRLL